MIDLENGGGERKKSAQEERRRRREEEDLREIERRGEQEEKNFATMMAGITAAMGGARSSSPIVTLARVDVCEMGPLVARDVFPERLGHSGRGQERVVGPHPDRNSRSCR